MKHLLPVLFLFFIACSSSPTEETAVVEETLVIANPPAPGFNAEASDDKAMALADSVMAAMGGRKAWDDTKVIQWTFFGRRTHTWDKWNGRDSINIPARNMVIDFNINTGEGDVLVDGTPLTDPDTLNYFLQRGKSMWINDAYWLVMPFKLKDSGVTLKYNGTVDVAEDGRETDDGGAEPTTNMEVIKLTFDQVGDTPQNMYEVFIDPSDYLVKQWKYYPTAEDTARFTTPWVNYEKHGEILLSGDRGPYQLSDIRVFEEWPQ